MGGKAPTPPSPQQGLDTANKIASGQQNYNIGAQAGSQYNQYNPYGSLQYVQTGVGPNGVPTYSALSNFSPEQAPLWAQALMSKGIAGGEGTSLLGGANYGFGGQPKDVIGNSARGITGDIIGGQMSFLDPFQNTERDQLDTKLKNQGLHPGNPAYDNAMRGLDTSQNLARGKIIGDATPQAYNIASQQYTMPMMMAMALGQYGSPTNPSSMYGATPALQPANLQGAFSSSMDALNNQYQAQLAAYQANQNNMWAIPSAVLGGWSKAGFPIPA
jgi:hypothetical protein